MPTYVAQEVGSAPIGQGFLDRGQAAYATGAVLAFPSQDGKVTRLAKQVAVGTVAITQAILRRPVYGIPLFGGGNLAGGTTATTVGTNAGTATGPTTGQQWPRGVKVG